MPVLHTLEERPNLAQTHRQVVVGVDAHVVAQHAVGAVPLVVRRRRVDVAVQVDAPVAQPLPVDHGIVAKHQLEALALELDDRRLHDERARHLILRPVLVVVARHEVDVLAADALADGPGLLGHQLEREVAQDVEVVAGRHARVDVRHEPGVHLLDGVPALVAVGEAQHVGVAKVRVGREPDHGIETSNARGRDARPSAPAARM